MRTVKVGYQLDSRDPPSSTLRVCNFMNVERVAIAPRPEFSGDVSSLARAPKIAGWQATRAS